MKNFGKYFDGSGRSRRRVAAAADDDGVFDRETDDPAVVPSDTERSSRSIGRLIQRGRRSLSVSSRRRQKEGREARRAKDAPLDRTKAMDQSIDSSVFFETVSDNEEDFTDYAFDSDEARDGRKKDRKKKKQRSKKKKKKDKRRDSALSNGNSNDNDNDDGGGDDDDEQASVSSHAESSVAVSARSKKKRDKQAKNRPHKVKAKTYNGLRETRVDALDLHLPSSLHALKTTRDSSHYNKPHSFYGSLAADDDSNDHDNNNNNNNDSNSRFGDEEYSVSSSRPPTSYKKRRDKKKKKKSSKKSSSLHTDSTPKKKKKKPSSKSAHAAHDGERDMSGKPGSCKSFASFAQSSYQGSDGGLTDDTGEDDGVYVNDIHSVEGESSYDVQLNTGAPVEHKGNEDVPRSVPITSAAHSSASSSIVGDSLSFDEQNDGAIELNDEQSNLSAGSTQRSGSVGDLDNARERRLLVWQNELQQREDRIRQQEQTWLERLNELDVYFAELRASCSAFREPNINNETILGQRETNARHIETILKEERRLLQQQRQSLDDGVDHNTPSPQDVDQDDGMSALRVAQLEDEIRELQKQLDETIAELREEKLARAREAIQRQQNRVDDDDQSTSHTRRGNSAFLQGEIEVMTHKLQEKEEQLQEQKQEVARLKRHIEQIDTTGTVSDLQEKLDTLEEESTLVRTALVQQCDQLSKQLLAKDKYIADLERDKQQYPQPWQNRPAMRRGSAGGGLFAAVSASLSRAPSMQSDDEKSLHSNSMHGNSMHGTKSQDVTEERPRRRLFSRRGSTGGSGGIPGMSSGGTDFAMSTLTSNSAHGHEPTAEDLQRRSNRRRGSISGRSLFGSARELDTRSVASTTTDASLEEKYVFYQ